MYCTKCGALLEPEARFCQECGTRVTQVLDADAVSSGAATQALGAGAAMSDMRTQALGASDIENAQTRALGDLPSVDGQPANAATDARDAFASRGQTMQMPAQRPVSAANRQSVPPIQQGAAQPKATFGAVPKRRSAAPGIILAIICALAIVGIAFFVLNPAGKVSTASSSASSASSQNSASSSSASAASSADASAASSSAASSDAASSKSAEPVFDQAKAEADARQKASNAGMQLFSGTLRLTTYGQRAAEISPRLASDFSSMADEPLALLEFSMPENVTASASGDQGRLQTRANQDGIALADPWSWADFDGQLVTVAAYPEDLMFPSDVVGALYSAGGAAVLVSPLTEQRAADLSFERAYSVYYVDPPVQQTEEPEQDKSSASASSPKTSSGDYVLADSATHRYSKSELKGLSDYELFIARNEIYARYGRRFQSEELQKYFNSKSWYKGTIDSAAFDESVLNDTELANASTILEVEQSRGSKFL